MWPPRNARMQNRRLAQFDVLKTHRMNKWDRLYRGSVGYRRETALFWRFWVTQPGRRAPEGVLMHWRAVGVSRLAASSHYRPPKQ